MNNTLFESLKVIELASVLAGPSVGMFFAEHGAHVTKIENKISDGDITRKWKLPQEDLTKKTSAYYDSVNYGKHSIFLDLSEANQREQLYELVRDADIIISNYLPAVAQKLHVTYNDLLQINNRILFGQIIGYKHNPELPAYDAVMQAEMGYISMNGTQDGQPAKMPVALIDVLAAHQLKEGILSALWKREQTNKGAYIEVALDETALSSLVNQASNYLQVGHIPKRMGTLHPNIAPYGEILTSSDGSEIMLAAGTNKQYFNLIQVFNLDKKLSKYDTNGLRLVHREEIYSDLKQFALSVTKMELKQMLNEGQIPFGEVRTLKEVFEINAYKKLILSDLNHNSLGIVKSSIFTIDDATIQ